MRTMKKTIAFVLAFAMAFATAFSAIGAKVTASAAAPTNFTVKMHSDGTFVASNVNKELQVGVATVKKGVATVKVWDTYSPSTIKVDANGEIDATNGADVDGVKGYITLSPKKDMVVAFRTVKKDTNSALTASYGEPTDTIFWEIQKNTAKYKAKIKIEKGTDQAKVELSGGEANTDFTVTSAQLGEGTVNASTKIVDSNLYNVGATLQVVPKGSSSVTTPVNDKFKYLDKDITLTNVVQSDAKAINVKLKKRANAPVVRINYIKNSVTIPKNSEYKIIGDTSAPADWASSYLATSDKKVVELSGSAGLVQVYKAATEKALSSKVGVATFAANDVIADISATSTTGLAVSYKDGGDLTIDNKIDAVVEYFIGANEPNSSTKWTKIKAKGKATIKAAKVDKNGKLYARRAADAKNFKIAGLPWDADVVAPGVQGYDYVEVANADKIAVTITSTTITTSGAKDAGGTDINDIITVKFGQPINGTVECGSGASRSVADITNGTFTLTKKGAAWADNDPITVTLSDASAKEYKLPSATIKVNAATPTSTAFDAGN